MQRIMTWTRCGICRAEAVPFKNASRTSDGDGVSMGGSGRVDDAMPHLGGPPPPPMNLERHPGLLGTGVLGSGQVSLMMVGGRLRRQQVTEMPPREMTSGHFLLDRAPNRPGTANFTKWPCRCARRNYPLPQVRRVGCRDQPTHHHHRWKSPRCCRQRAHLPSGSSGLCTPQRPATPLRTFEETAPRHRPSKDKPRAAWPPQFELIYSLQSRRGACREARAMYIPDASPCTTTTP